MMTRSIKCNESLFNIIFSNSPIKKRSLLQNRCLNYCRHQYYPSVNHNIFHTFTSILDKLVSIKNNQS